MKISELIHKLIELKNEHGDNKIYITKQCIPYSQIDMIGNMALTNCDTKQAFEFFGIELHENV